MKMAEQFDCNVDQVRTQLIQAGVLIAITLIVGTDSNSLLRNLDNSKLIKEKESSL